MIILISLTIIGCIFLVGHSLILIIYTKIVVFCQEKITIIADANAYSIMIKLLIDQFM